MATAPSRQRPAVKAFLLDLAVLEAAFLLTELLRGGFAEEGRWPYVGFVGIVLVGLFGAAASMVLQTFRLRFAYIAGSDVARLAGVAFTVSVARFILAGSRGFADGWFTATVLSFFFAISGLMAVRLLRDPSLNGNRKKGVTDGRRILVLGAGMAAEMLVRELDGGASHAKVIGFLDDDARKHGSMLRGRPVLGPLSEVKRFAEATEASEIVLAIPSLAPSEQKRVLGYCQGLKQRVQMMPSIARTLAEAGKSLPTLREIGPEELLNRQSIETDMSGAAAYVLGKVIMITGGGGSIGSELARQVATLGPKEIVLFGKGENSIFEAQQDLRERGFGEVSTYVGDVRDRASLDRAMERFAPDVVFHAAAHKHVPLMETVPIEAVRNNVFGTINVGQAAIAAGVERVIMISTDKAVNPMNVMGASKRVAEMVMGALAGASPTQFSAVRFGNVLGSRGSLIPILKRQITKGGPITITDERMTRFFMTIPEAAQLVIQAGSHGGGGEIFLLDMGEPVKIIDIARELLTLHGLVEGRDIEIRFIGARPGEKIHEELSWASEDVEMLDRGKIMRLKHQKPVGWEVLSGELARLKEVCDAGDEEAARMQLMSLAQGTLDLALQSRPQAL